MGEVVGERRGLWRSRWAAVGAAVAVSLGGGGLLVANAASSPTSSVVTIDPVRILDTRDPINVGLPGPFVSAVSQKLQVTGAAVPAGATGVLLNVTVVGPTANGFLSVRPGDAAGAPSTSSLNFNAGDLIPNSVQVGLPTAGANAGQIDITYDAYGVAGPTTDVLIDVVGYMVASGAGAGPPAPAGPNIRWAKVAANSSGARLLSGSGVASVGRFTAGSFSVVFNASIVGCGWTATLNDDDAGVGRPGQISVEREVASSTTNLIVRTYSPNGTQSDPQAGNGFTVTVICP